ncbi:MAG: VWA domain-containing protein [Burkholderiales bacterium]|nr:VWA domain-containing protein [Burkholderiales bacterium]
MSSPSPVSASPVDPAAGPAPEPAGRYDQPYDRLAALPRPVWLPALTAAVGSREQRLDHARAWLAALDLGRLPDATIDFGDGEACAPLRAIVDELGLPSLAQGVATLAEQVVRTVLWHLDLIPDLMPRLDRPAAIAQATAEFREAWRVDTAGLDHEMALLRELIGGEHLHWDEIRGQLRSREWQAARRAAELLADLPVLAELLRRLGRSLPRELAPPRKTPRPDAAAVRLPLKAIETRIPGAPGELTGIHFSAQLERMLPGEAALLRHPIGRRLWRARHAEGRLLAFDSEAVLIDWRPDPDSPLRAASSEQQTQRLDRGPLILCLDTSGSMRGAPEHIAKAVVIAALRAAHGNQRGCRLIAFGGPGELLECDLAGRGGLKALLDFMGMGFDGGTDIQTPIERAIELVHESAWNSADLVIVSDGEFGCVPATLASLDQARSELGLQIHGILVGDRETMGMLEVCDEIHWVRDWRRHGEDGDTRIETRLAKPVHSKSLTALYFPNALSPRAAKKR